MNAIDLHKKIETFSNLIQEFGTATFSSKELWQRQREIAENFKAAQFLNEELKDTATQKFQQLINQLKEKENLVAVANEKFTEEAENLIVSMEVIVAKNTVENELSKDDFTELRKISNQAFEYFKLPRWTSKEKRNEAWERYNNIRNIVKEKEDSLYAKVREDRTKQVSQSLEITEKICMLVDACNPNYNIEDLQQLVVRFNNFVNDANLPNTDKHWHLLEKNTDLKYSLKCRTETLNDIRNFITINKEAITRENKNEIFAGMDALKTDLNKAWETHKEELEIKKKERDEKRLEWNKKQQDFLKMLEGRLENQIGYKAKQESYLQSQKEFAARFEARIPQQKDYISKLQEQYIDLEKKYATAWTDSFKTKVEEWMKEKLKKIADVDKDIVVLNEKISDINKNVELLPTKIQELDASINEIKNKIEEVKDKLKNDKLVPLVDAENNPNELKEVTIIEQQNVS